MRTPGPARGHEDLVARFVDACATDDRILAVYLAGSIVLGEADEFSDVDFGVVTTDAAFAHVTAERSAIARRLGDPMFVEDFGNTDVVFVILAYLARQRSPLRPSATSTGSTPGTTRFFTTRVASWQGVRSRSPRPAAPNNANNCSGS